ncbi:TetR/AcrR family transcriptional regulator [Lachnoclostridium phytofermentans]|uniref:TetR/AcrR family transcriptional regulator n=1 Tax=Lachnoclostridium phytofermentans TaxID=66219 RepID=UPI0004956902|nr:TetR/AcrR family transcriptional regulator [Lachnoclostridium phytofermentans]
MNEKFMELPEEKQLKVINAAMEVFAKNEYKHAVTDDIASKAGISKGLLFYYFKNKKNLYLHVFHYTMDVMRKQILDEKFQEIDDFFELLEYASYKKCAIIEKNPYLMDFTMKCIFGDKENVSPELQKDISKETGTIYSVYFKNINLNKFREDISPEYLTRMLTWMSEGYVLEKKMQGKCLIIEDIMADFKRWSQVFRKIAYKEEYLNESN